MLAYLQSQSFERLGRIGSSDVHSEKPASISKQNKLCMGWEDVSVGKAAFCASVSTWVWIYRIGMKMDAVLNACNPIAHKTRLEVTQEDPQKQKLTG